MASPSPSLSPLTNVVRMQLHFVKTTHREITNAKGDAKHADFNRSGIDVIALARPRSLLAGT